MHTLMIIQFKLLGRTIVYYYVLSYFLLQFTPAQGPTDGGTVITINGSNLGASRSDIDSVWIQDVVCIVMGYTAGRQ